MSPRFEPKSGRLLSGRRPSRKHSIAGAAEFLRTELSQIEFDARMLLQGNMADRVPIAEVAGWMSPKFQGDRRVALLLVVGRVCLEVDASIVREAFKQLAPAEQEALRTLTARVLDEERETFLTEVAPPAPR